MRLNRETKKMVYDVFKSVYHTRVGQHLTLEKGESQKCVASFTRMSEHLGIRDEDRFQEVLQLFYDYALSVSADWLSWSECNRYNFIGYIGNKDRIGIFCNKSKVSLGKKIAGTIGKEDWDL